MKFIAAVLLLGAGTAQDGGDLAARARALLERATSLDPDVRAEAREGLRKIAAGEGVALQEAAKEDSVARIVLTFHAIPEHRKSVEKLLAHEDPVLVRAAAEALGYVAPDASVRELLALLQGEDLAAAMAAARSLAKAKIPAVRAAVRQVAEAIDNVHAKMVAIYSVELVAPSVDRVKAVLAQSENPDTAIRRASWAVLLNLPHAAEEGKGVRSETGNIVLPGLRKIFEEEKLPEEDRVLLGKVLLAANGYFYGELIDYVIHETEEVAQWARKFLLDPKILKKSVLIEGLIRKLEEIEEETAENKDDIIALEMLLQSQGAEAVGEKLEEKAKSYREWWNRNRISTIDRDVVNVIDDGVAWLRKGQKEDGSWDYCTCRLRASANTAHAKGTTALAVYTLIKCDVPEDDPQVVKGLEYLLTIPVSTKQHTYTVSLEAMAFAEAFEKIRSKARQEKNRRRKVEYARTLQVYAKRLQEAANWLMRSMRVRRRGGYACGEWTYGTGNDHADNSNNQFAVLGLRSAQNAGVPVPAKIWAASYNHWFRDQVESGGWPYRTDPTKPPPKWGSRSMTAAGYYCYLVTKASLKRRPPEQYLSDASIKKTDALYLKSYPIAKAKPSRQAGHVHSLYYELYSIERAMMISKQDKLGRGNWYHDGAIAILTNQFHAGEWIDTTDTCFALLFLKRAFVAVATGPGK